MRAQLRILKRGSGAKVELRACLVGKGSGTGLAGRKLTLAVECCVSAELMANT